MTTTSQLGPIDATLQAALAMPRENLLGPATEGPHYARVRIACAPMAVRITGARNGLDAAATAPWDAVRAACAKAYPSLAWPLGFTLSTRRNADTWGAWELSGFYVFGAKANMKAIGLDPEAPNSWRWGWKKPFGLDALAQDFARMERLVPASNAEPRSWSQAHAMMGYPFVNSDRVVARTETEALAKHGWVRGGWKGVAEASAREDRGYATWMVAADIADWEHDGFGQAIPANTAAMDLAQRLANETPST